MGPTDVVERHGVADGVSGRLVQAQPALRVHQRGGGVALLVEHVAEGQAGGRLAELVAVIDVEVERLVQVRPRVMETASEDVRLAEEAMGARLAGGVVELLSRAQSSLQGGDPVLPAPTPMEILGKGPGQPRSEEHTSELQSLRHLVCRLLLEK